MITLIIGLPGSGKSHFAKTLKCDLLIDDIKSIFDLPTSDFSGHMVIVDANFCNPNTFHAAGQILKLRYYPNHELECIYFTNDPEQCKKNVLDRDDRNVLADIDVLSNIYNPPRIDKEVWKS